MSLFRQSARLPQPSEALPGRSTPMQVAGRHAVLYAPLATSESQLAAALASKARYQSALDGAGRRAITTEVAPAPAYYIRYA
jgi:hypothetical protein